MASVGCETEAYVCCVRVFFPGTDDISIKILRKFYWWTEDAFTGDVFLKIVIWHEYDFIEDVFLVTFYRCIGPTFTAYHVKHLM
jgi:hypothetical protein